MLGALMLTACGGGSETEAAQSGQPDKVVTSRSDGKAIANPRRGGFTKSDPKAPAGYMSPEEVHRTTPEPRSTYTQ
jgi:hypothetical protein